MSKLRFPWRSSKTDGAPAQVTAGQAKWWTPWTWVGANGVYVGDDGAWLYRRLPMSVAALEGWLALLSHPTAMQRELHVLSVAWSAPIEEDVVRTSGTALDDYLVEVLKVNAPIRRLMVGAKLKGVPKAVSTWGAVGESVDRLLGEYVPNFAEFDEDAAMVNAWLESMAAQPLDSLCRDMLEAWYTLGHQDNVSAVEEDAAIRMTSGQTLTFATGNPDPSSQRFAPAALPPPPSRTATCASARFTVAKEGLSRLSLVYGRSAVGAPPWVEQLAAVMPAASPAGLPLRQLPALEETLPCASTRLNPGPLIVPVATLEQAGFTDPAPVGDPSGLLLGMGGVGFTDPIRFNPLSPGGSRLSVVAGRGGGKTFLAEHVAYQAMLAGLTVRYISADGEAGRVLVENGAESVVSASAGMFDVGRLPREFAELRKAMLAGLSSATPQVDAPVFERAASRGLSGSSTLLPSLAETATLIHTARDAAALRRASSKEFSLAWAALKEGEGIPEGSSAWSARHVVAQFIEDFGTRAAALELLVVAALLRPIPKSSPGLLVVVDGVPTGALVELAFSTAARAGWPLGLVVTSSSVPESVDGFTCFGPGLDLQALARVGGLRLLDQRLAGARAYADIDAGQVVRSASVFSVVDTSGRVGPLVVAPASDELLPALTRRPAAVYK